MIKLRTLVIVVAVISGLLAITTSMRETNAQLDEISSQLDGIYNS